MSRVLLLFPTHTYRASAFLEAAARLGIDVVIGSEQAHVLSGDNPGGFMALDFQDLEAATEHGICVTNVPDYCLEEVSDHTMLLILALYRKLLPTVAAVTCS